MTSNGEIIAAHVPTRLLISTFSTVHHHHQHHRRRRRLFSQFWPAVFHQALNNNTRGGAGLLPARCANERRPLRAAPPRPFFLPSASLPEHLIGAPIFLASRKREREARRNRRGNSRNSRAKRYAPPFQEAVPSTNALNPRQKFYTILYRIVSYRGQYWLDNFRFDQFTRGQFGEIRKTNSIFMSI